MSELLEEKVIELKLDRSAWQLVKFGDVAIQQKGSVDRNNTELSKYIKGEHMSSEDLHLREWGELTDEYLGPAFIRKFEEGDILYGSRRTYLRKVAVAHFSGITSNTTFVIKANEAKIDKRLLPFVMLSEGFAEHSIRNSKGSVNPYVNWKDLANYEFLLPPKDQQAKLAELLWAMDEVVETEFNLLTNLKKQLDINETTYFCGNTHRKKLGQVVKNTLSGGTPNTKVLDFYENGTVPWITTKILESDVINAGEKYITEGAIKNSAAKKLLAGNIVAGTRVGVGKFCINQIDLSFSQDITGLIVNLDEVDIEFLVYQLNSNIFQKKIKPFIRGTTIQGITKDDLLNLSILAPERLEQFKVKNILKNIKDGIKYTTSKIEHSKSLQKSLINQIF